MTAPTDSKAPTIRFNGFHGDWVEKKLGELINLGSGRDYKHLSPGSVPVYGTGGYMLSVNEALSNSVDAVGIGRKGTIDKPYILKAPFWTVDTLFYAIPKAENYLDFVYCIFQRIDWKQKDESTGVPSLSKVAINGVSVLSTIPSEQIKIGEYFRALDSLIGMHQRKHDKLSTLKKAMLQKMFPQVGATTPEIRFKGGEGNWVGKNVSEICGETYGGGTPRTSEHKLWKGRIPWIQSSDITDGEVYKVVPRKYISDLALRQSPTKLVPEKSIAVVTRVGVGKLALIEFSYATSQDFISLGKLKVDSSFAVVALSILLQSKLHETQGTSIKGITKDELLAYSFTTPPTIEEQQKIGNYFRQLDDLISRHATQIQKLKQIKAACLEKMFV